MNPCNSSYYEMQPLLKTCKVVSKPNGCVLFQFLCMTLNCKTDKLIKVECYEREKLAS